MLDIEQASRNVCDRMGQQNVPVESFFEKVGIQFPLWEHGPMGHACDASGMHLTLTAMMPITCASGNTSMKIPPGGRRMNNYLEQS